MKDDKDEEKFPEVVDGKLKGAKSSEVELDQFDRAGNAIDDLVGSQVKGLRTRLRESAHRGRMDKISNHAEEQKLKLYVHADLAEIEIFVKSKSSLFSEHLKTAIRNSFDHTENERSFNKMDRIEELLADHDRRLIAVETNGRTERVRDLQIKILSDHLEETIEAVMGDKIAKRLGLA